MCADFPPQAADGCVGNRWSMEFGKDLASQILIGGSGTQKQRPAPDSGTRLSWAAQYGDAGLNAVDQPLIIDGMNACPSAP